MADEKGNLVRKMCHIMETVPYIQKRGYNKFHDYHYALEADVSDAIRKKLAELDVLFVPSLEETIQREVTTRKGNAETVTRTRIHYRFIDGDSGEEIEGYMEGEGQDPGDKGIYKAITGTIKYVLMKVFLIPTGDDPEADEEIDEGSAVRQTSPMADEPEVNPATGEEIPSYPDIALPPPGTKGINDVRVLLGHAQVLGWSADKIIEWVEHRTGKAPCELGAAQAKALKDAIKKEKQ